MHYMPPDGSPGSDNSPNALLKRRRGGDGDSGERRMSRITPQMDANGAPLSGSVTSHEMGGVGPRSDP